MSVVQEAQKQSIRLYKETRKKSLGRLEFMNYIYDSKSLHNAKRKFGNSRYPGKKKKSEKEDRIKKRKKFILKKANVILTFYKWS